MDSVIIGFIVADDPSFREYYPLGLLALRLGIRGRAWFERRFGQSPQREP